MNWIILASFITLVASQDDPSEPKQVPQAATIQPTIHLSVSESPVHVGRNVTFICKIDNYMQDGSNVGTRVWTKTVGRHLEKDTDVISTSDDVLLPPYDSMNRYGVEQRLEGNSVYQFLYIYGVQREDSGRFHCTLMAAQGHKFNFTTTSTTLNVYTDTDNVTSYNNQTTGEEKINAKEGDNVLFKCVVEGGKPDPEVKVMLGDMDKTSHFNVTKTPRRFCTGDAFVKKCAIHADNKISLEPSNYKVDYTFHNKEMTCSAEVKNSGFPMKLARAKYEVTFIPKFECPTIQKARNHATNAMLYCKVFANPALSEAHWKFNIGGSTEETIKPDDPKKHGITSTSRAESDGSVTHILTFDQVLQKHFTEYTLKATNNEGINTTRIQFKLDTSPVAGADKMMSSLVAMVMMAIFAFLLH